MALDASRVNVPEWMRDEDNPDNPFGSSAVRASHVLIAARKQYTLKDILGAAVENPGVDQRVDTLLSRGHEISDADAPPPLESLDTDLCTIGAETQRLQLGHDAHFQTFYEEEHESLVPDTLKVERKARKVAVATELWLCLAARTANQHVLPFLTICLSLLALQSGMSDDMWSVLRFMLVIHSKPWITRFAQDVYEKLRSELLSDEDVIDNVRFVVGDNCDYHTRIVHEHTDRSGEYMHTVNWLTVPLRKSVVGGISLAYGAWRRAGVSKFCVRGLFDPCHTESTTFKLSSWRGFMQQARAAEEPEDILRHPNVPKPPRTETIYEEPITDTGTAAYKDVDKFLTKVRLLWLWCMGLPKSLTRRVAGASIVLVVGDHQTWSRMLWLKLYHPQRYQWLLMLPGEFHFTVHALMALHILWWHALGAWVVLKLDCSKTIKRDWTSVEKYKYYDHFYQLMIATLAAHLARVVPAPLLHQPEALLHAVRHNPAAVHAVRFLYEFGLPWLALRQGIRGNLSSVVNVMWRVTYHWFSATGKTNYRIMSVIVTFITAAMVPELGIIWLVMRTASLSGHAGRNVAWDFVVERFNRMCKQALGTNVTRERLLYYVPILNTFRHVWPRFLHVMGRGDSEASDYSHITPGDRETLMAAWEAALGSTYDELRAVTDNYAFHVPDGKGGGGKGNGGGKSKGGGKGAKAAVQRSLMEPVEGGTPADPWLVTLERAKGSGALVAGVSAEADLMVGYGNESEYEIDQISKSRYKGAHKEFYVHWKGWEGDPQEWTWEPRAHLTMSDGSRKMVEEFEDDQSSRKRRTKQSKTETEDDSNTASSNGEDSDEDGETKAAPWYKDVSTILLEKVPRI